MAKSQKTGYKVEFTDKATGQKKKGHAYYGEPKAGIFAEQGKIIVREVDDAGNHVIKNGREVVLILDKADTKETGYIH